MPFLPFVSACSGLKQVPTHPFPPHPYLRVHATDEDENGVHSLAPTYDASTSMFPLDLFIRAHAQDEFAMVPLLS